MELKKKCRQIKLQQITDTNLPNDQKLPFQTGPYF
jgi:hypothetical protein